MIINPLTVTVYVRFTTGNHGHPRATWRTQCISPDEVTIGEIIRELPRPLRGLAMTVSGAVVKKQRTRHVVPLRGVGQFR